MTSAVPLRVRLFDPTGTALRPDAQVPLGGFVIATVDSEYLDAAVGEITHLRRRLPWAPLGLIVPDLTGTHFKAAAVLADLTAARFVLFRARPFPEVRALLLSMDTLAEDFVSTLRLHRPDLEPEGRILNDIERLVSGGAAGRSLNQLSVELGVGLRGVEKRLARGGLMPPSAYTVFGGLAATFASLSRDPQMKVERAALSLSPYQDYTSFANATRRRLGTSPTAARVRLSWEWIAFRLGLFERRGVDADEGRRIIAACEQEVR